MGGQRGQSAEVRRDVFADRGVGAPACFDGADARRGEGVVAGEEFGVFAVGGALGKWDGKDGRTEGWDGEEVTG